MTIVHGARRGAPDRERASGRRRLAAVALAAAMVVTGLVAGAAPAVASGLDEVWVDPSRPTSAVTHARFTRENGLATTIEPYAGYVVLIVDWLDSTWVRDLPDLQRSALVTVGPLDDSAAGQGTTSAGVEVDGSEVTLYLEKVLAGLGSGTADPSAGLRMAIRTPPGFPHDVDVVAEILLDQTHSDEWDGHYRHLSAEADPESVVLNVHDTVAVRGTRGSTVVVSQGVPSGNALFSGMTDGSLSVTWTPGRGATPVPVPVRGMNEIRAAVTLPSDVVDRGVLEFISKPRQGLRDVVRVPVVPPVADPVDAYITAVYEDLLGRQPDAEGLAHWARALRSGTAHGEVANAITSSREFRTRLIVDAYRSYLGRDPEAGGVTHWLTQMDRGLQIEQLEAEILASEERFARHYHDFDHWLWAVYGDVLDRAPDRAGLDNWFTVYARQGRTAVTRGLLYSTEHLTTVVSGYYESLLHRSIDPSGRNTWVGAIQAGHRDEEIVASILSSAEYRANVPRP